MSEKPLHDRIWFWSDPHLDHGNIRKFCNRPFSSTHEMNEALIKNYNERVDPGDDVYFLGDIFFCSPAKAIAIMDRLHGNKHCILGNHDKVIRNQKPLQQKFAWVKDYYELKVQDEDARGGMQHIVLFHYAMRVWNKSHHGSWSLYGHSHNNLPDLPTSLSMDIGVDAHNYYPISYREVKNILKKKTFKPVDHHGEY